MSHNHQTRTIPPELRSHLNDRREASRQAILDAACQLIIANSYSRTSVTAIAKSAGVSPATVYNAFETKRAIFEALVAREVASAQWPFAEEIPRFRSALEAARFIAARMKEAFTNTVIPELTEVAMAEDEDFPELRVLYRTETGDDLTQSLAETVLADLVAQELFRVRNIPFAARQFLGMLNQALFNEKRTRGREIEELDSYIESCVQLFCSAYARR